MVRISIETTSPNTVKVDEVFNITFNFTNTYQQRFLGCDVNIKMIWANLDSNNIFVNRSFRVGALDPNESVEMTFKEKPRTEGMLIFYLHGFDPKDLRGNNIDFRFSDGKPLDIGQIFHTVRVRSSEEIYQYWANIIAGGALLLLIIFQLIDWYLQGFYCARVLLGFFFAYSF